MPVTKKQMAVLERTSLENSRDQSSKDGSERIRVPQFMQKRRGHGEEDLPAPFLDRVREKFSENDPDNSGSIGMESFGLMISELDLAQEDEGEVMEEAFQGLDLDERDSMRFDEFHTIARRLYFRKKLEEDRKKMAEISEEQIESVFSRYKVFNQRSEEDCLTERSCYDALRRLRIKLNPQEYQRKFHEYDENGDRHINFEEFRRFLGKEPREKSEKK